MSTEIASGERTILVVPARKRDLREKVQSEPFAAMLAAFGDVDLDDAAVRLHDLVSLGCVELCCVGPKSEQLHDILDNAIEDAGLLQIVTTWHREVHEGCEYFIFAAGGRPRLLLALVAEHEEVVRELRVTAAEGQRSEPMK